jgi:hypothetical protein
VVVRAQSASVLEPLRHDEEVLDALLAAARLRADETLAAARAHAQKLRDAAHHELAAELAARAAARALEDESRVAARRAATARKLEALREAARAGREPTIAWLLALVAGAPS